MSLRTGPPAGFIIGLCLGLLTHLQWRGGGPDLNAASPQPRLPAVPQTSPRARHDRQPTPQSAPPELRAQRARYLTLHGKPPPLPSDPSSFDDTTMGAVVDAVADQHNATRIGLDCAPYPCRTRLLQHTDDPPITSQTLSEWGYPDALVTRNALAWGDETNTWFEVGIVFVDQPLDGLERQYAYRAWLELKSSTAPVLIEALEERAHAGD